MVGPRLPPSDGLPQLALWQNVCPLHPPPIQPSNPSSSGTLINPTWFALHTSRALDNYHLKLFMRSTSLLSEYFIYIPPLLLLTRTLSLDRKSVV